MIFTTVYINICDKYNYYTFWNVLLSKFFASSSSSDHQLTIYYHIVYR